MMACRAFVVCYLTMAVLVADASMSVTLATASMGCENPNYVLSYILNNALECAELAIYDSRCTKVATIMWSDANPDWGCRCCDPASEYVPNDNWDLYNFTSNCALILNSRASII